MSLTYGLDGIRQRSYRVWLVYPFSGSGGWDENDQLSNFIDVIIEKIDEYKYASAFTNLSKFISGTLEVTEYSEKLGECRKDSISLTGEDGDSIEGNEIGTLVLGKNCSFSCELLNATADNIAALLADVESQTTFFIVLEEVDGQTKVWATGKVAPNDFVTSYDTHEIIFVGVNNALIASFSENHVGGGISTVTLTVNDSVARLSDFRAILDIPYDLDNVE
jgi:hypothetical protein